MYCKAAQWALLLLAAGTLGSCAKPVTFWRVAVLRYEDLAPGGDTEWIGRAISEEIAGQLEGTRHNAVIPFRALRELSASMGERPVGAPGISTEMGAALSAGANRIVMGFYTYRNGRLTITTVEETVGTGKEAAPLTESGSLDDLLHLSDSTAKSIDDESADPITGSTRALRAYALGIESPAAQEKGLLDEALRLDPDFGKPYVALAEMALAARDGDGFRQAFEAMRAQGKNVRAVDRAVLNLEDARLHAALPTRIDALGAVSRLMPANPFYLEELANAELQANRLEEAVDHYRRLETLMPASAEPLNMLGYGLTFAGDEAGAMKALASYRRATGDSANALDSMGDAQFFFGHFAEAEQSYRRAHQKAPGIADGAELVKATWTRLMRNDASGAAQLLGEYRAERARAGDPLAKFRAAQLLRVMGRGAEAEKLMAPYAESGAGAAGNQARAQLAWWRFLDGAGPSPDEQSPLGRAVTAYVRGDNQTAVRAGRELVDASGPNDWWTRAFYARLLDRTGQKQEEERFRRYAPIPQPNRALSLDELWYPWLIHARGKVE